MSLNGDISFFLAKYPLKEEQAFAII